MNSRIAALAATAALAAALAGCSGTSNTVSQPPAPAASAPAAAPAAAPATTPANDVAAFGGTVTWPGGVKVTVSQPTAVPASEFASGAVEGKLVKFNISVTNGSDKPLNAALMGASDVSYGASGEVAQHGFDQDTVGFFRTILPGETQTVKEAYGVPSAGFGELRVEITGPDAISDQPAVFKGPVK